MTLGDRRASQRGFSLVELLTTVAIVAVLAALAVQGVRRYLATAKSAEARATVGAIARAASMAFERESALAEDIPEGGLSTGASHALCASAIAVPGAVPKGRKYQPRTTPGFDYDTGDGATGWRSSGSSGSAGNGSSGSSGNAGSAGNGNSSNGNGTGNGHSGASGGAPVSNNPNACTGTDCFEALAQGDLDGDGVVSQFSLVGRVANGELKPATQIFILDETE